MLKRPGVGFAMLAILLVFTGHFSFFTYIRPFLETVSGIGAPRSGTDASGLDVIGHVQESPRRSSSGARHSPARYG